MIRLRPIGTQQTFSIIPTSFAGSVLNAASISLTENGTHLSENNVTFTWALSTNGNFVEISMTPTITLVADQIYTLELATTTDVLYRDLIYITSSTDKEQVFSYPDVYDEYDSGEDDYIVL